MPEFEPDYEDDDEDGSGQGGQSSAPSNNDLRKLRKAAKERDELLTKVAQFERDNAFRDAGINPSDPKAKYFVKGYDGEMTADAIKGEAQAAGLLQSEEEQQQQEQTRQQQEQQRNQQEQTHFRMDLAGTGATPLAPDATAELIQKMTAAKDMDELVEIATAAGMPTVKNR